jgi:hypothetical protein
MRAIVTATVCSVLAFGSSPLSAQSITTDLAIRAVVPKYCTVGGRIGPIVLRVTFRVDAGGLVDARPQTFTIPDVVCNAPATLAISSTHGGAQPSGTTPVSFTNTARLDWTATARFGNASAVLEASATGSPQQAPSGTTGTPTLGTVLIEVAPKASPAQLQAPSVWVDELRVVLVPR